MSLLATILHLDLDCFYAQVERERLKLEPNACVAVVQWTSALAVTYPARAFGINRGTHIDDIRRLGGDAVTVVHVETIGGASGAEVECIPHGDSVNTQKVSLARYRAASARVFEAMLQAIEGYGAVLERASVDEAFIDVSAEVERRVRTGRELKGNIPGMVIVGDKIDLGNASDLRLMHGADIADEVRGAVLTDCHYTMSAGISMNKLLAKFASAKNKPNGQTVVPLSAIDGLMDGVPLTKLRGLGGKLGKEVEELGVKTAGEAKELGMEVLEAKLGRKFAEFVYNSVRGVDDTPVKERDKTKSLLAAKSFQRSMTLQPVEQKWLPILSEELAERVGIESDLHNRHAKNLVVSFRVQNAKENGEGEMITASRTVAMPVATNEARAEAIMKVGLAVLKKIMREEHQFSFPITFVGLTGTSFVERAAGKESISKYFSATGEKEDRVVEQSDASLDSGAVHQRRLQEREDKELALQLHREESLRSLGKPIRKRTTKPGNSGRRGSHKGGKNGSAGTLTLDQFGFGKKQAKS